MQPETVIAIYAAGVVVGAIAFGALLSPREDKSISMLAFFWPFLAFCGVVIGVFWSLATFGQWLGAKLKLHT